MENGNDFTCNKTEDKRGVVEYFYLLEDKDWHLRVHKRAGSSEENINDTLSSIADESVMYVIKRKDELCGFFVRYQDGKNLVLEGFHISKKYRIPFFFEIFWSFVKSKFEKSFFTGIYYKNTEAINHLTRQGFEFVSNLIEDNKEFYILKFKK
jgi:hypothetical protein